MVKRNASISATLSDSETERWLINTDSAHAVRAAISSDGEPYDVDIQTAPLYPGVGSFDTQDFSTVLPGGARTLRETSEVQLATDMVNEAVFVEITNNAGSDVTFSGSIDTYGFASDRSLMDFLMGPAANRPHVWVDGESVQRNTESTYVPQDLTASAAPEPGDDGTLAVHDGTGSPAAGLYRSDSGNTQWVKVEDNTTTISY